MKPTLYDVENLRRDFPMLQKEGACTYLDTAATAYTPECVIEAITHFYREGYATVNRAVYASAEEATQRYHGVREQVRSFIGAKRCEEIVFTKGATEGLNLLAFCLGRSLKRGDEILISSMEHHANIVPWQMVCQERGAVLKVIPVQRGERLSVEHLKPLLTKRTKILSIAHMTNMTGEIYPVRELIREAKKVGAVTVVDGAQAIAHIEVDVGALDCDFYVFSGHKLYGPTGVGVLYGKRELLNALPPYQGGGDMIDTVSYEKTTYQPSPARFEAGTPMIGQVLGLGAAIAYLTSIGMKRIFAHERRLLHYAVRAFSQIKEVEMLGFALDPKGKLVQDGDIEQRGGIITFQVVGVHPLDMGTWCSMKGVAVRTGHLCTQPSMALYGIEQGIRISFGLYTTKEEIDKCIVVIQEGISFYSS